MSQNEAALRKLYELYGTGDPTYLWGILDDNVEWHSSAFGHWNGVDGVRECLNAMASAWNLTRHDFLGMSGTNDDTFEVRVAIEAMYRATGKAIRLNKTDKIRMRGGKIVKYEEELDASILARAMVIPS